MRHLKKLGRNVGWAALTALLFIPVMIPAVVIMVIFMLAFVVLLVIPFAIAACAVAVMWLLEFALLTIPSLLFRADFSWPCSAARWSLGGVNWIDGSLDGPIDGAIDLFFDPMEGLMDWYIGIASHVGGCGS